MARSSRRLLLALALAYVAMTAFTPVVYDADLAATAGALAGGLAMLVLAIGVAWASHRSG